MKVTEKEIIRANKTKNQIQKLHDKGYKLNEITISSLTANVMGIVFGLLFLAPIFIAYYYHFGYLFRGPEETLVEQLIVAVLFFASFAIHEGIHGLCMYFLNGKNKSLIEFGMMSGNPYCTCQSPVNKKQYLIFALMPTLVLGIIFLITAFIFGKVWWLLLLIATIVGGGGDFTIIWRLLKIKEKNVKIVDHPYKCGFFALSKDFKTDYYENFVSEINSLKIKNKD